MLSLIFTIVKYALGYKPSTDTGLNDINKVIARIKDAQNEDTSVLPQAESSCKEGYYYKTGQITFIGNDYVLVDDHYMCEAANVLVDNLKMKDTIYYLAFQKEHEKEQTICKIISVIDESWENVVDTSNFDTTRVQTLRRSIVGKVTKREGRKIFIEPANISIDLNKVNSNFIPFVGDWLKLDAIVEINENSVDLSGEILKVDGIQPLRSKLHIGIINSYDSIKDTGVIEKHIIFCKRVCESGYIPCIGDKVVSESVESDQGLFTWRSVCVVPLFQVPKKQLELGYSQTFRKNLGNLIEDKNGIIITTDLNLNLNIQEEKDITVIIKNSSTNTHIIQKCFFLPKKLNSQLSLTWPAMDDDIVLSPSESISYKFKCKARFVGSTEELFIFSFKDFNIGRIFRITVNAFNITTKACVEQYNKKNINTLIPDTQDEELYIPGIRPCKPPAFVKVRTGIFNVPQKYWNAVLNSIRENKTQIECEVTVGNAIPCLQKGLCFENYKDRFHALLYLEEIDHKLSMQKYDIESVAMKHCGEYLVLHVQGLAEKRPSLLIGDKAVVSFNWDKSQGKIKYEGYIHKITSMEVYLKFNQRFHQEYNGEDCKVTFKCSYTTMRRLHNAINLAVTHLGPEFLFPMRVIEKDPQLNLEEIIIEEKPCYKQFEHKRNESISSVCSSISMKSVSDGSCDSTVKSPPKISVAERLFNVKPIEQCSNSTKESSSSLQKYENINVDITNNKQHNETHILNSTGTTKPLHQKTELQSHVCQLKKRKLIWFNKDLNYYQKEAIKNILKGLARPLPYVIFGPPGTGKTVTLCETILQILRIVPESRLLVATPSNSSANLVMERLLDSGILQPGDLVRLIAHHCLEDDTIPEKLLPYCATGDLAAPGTREKSEYSENGPKLNCTINVLGRHRVTVGTCVALGLLYNMGFPRGHFSHVLVDEAGQATEPEIMIPLSFIHSDCGQVVLAGDPLQLGPIVQSTLANHFGLGESFLSRLLHQFPYQRDPESFETCYDPRLITKLVMNYRSLPEILEIPNSLFYDSELQPQVSSKKSSEAMLLQSVSSELPEREESPPAVIFHGINGENFRDSDNPSWYNPAEATQAYLYLVKLYYKGLSADDIGIITPYQKQVIQIRDLLLELNIESPKISTVEGFQGQERKVIILSTVRSSSNLINEDIKHALGFVASPRRLNVAITRARALLIILGNPHILIQDPYWRSVLIYCIDRGAYTGCNFLSPCVDDSLICMDNAQIVE